MSLITAILTVVLGLTLIIPSQVSALSVTINRPTAPTPPPFPKIELGEEAAPTSRPIQTASPNPTQTPRPTSSPTQQPTLVATPRPTFSPTSTPRPTSTPTSSTTPLSTSRVKDHIMNEINKYRASQGLYAVKTDPYTCSFAKIRAVEIASGFNHDGFRNRINSRTLPYPSYHYVNENIARTSNYRNVVNMWINSSGHARNMRADTPYVCVEQYGNNYAYEGWRP